jgi:hypothetical protein
MNKALQHDCAMAMGRSILDVVAPCIDPSRHKEALETFVIICEGGIEGYCLYNNSAERLHNPSNN